jgi:CheY-like chemotaxis protein
MGLLDSVKRWRASLSTPEALQTPPPASPAVRVDADFPEELAPDGYTGPERRNKPRVGARSGTRVLIIDDSPTIVTVLRKMMQQNDYRTFEAYSAEEALDLVQRERPDIIFLDIVLPGMDGFSALRTFRRDPSTKDVPIIMISGNAQATEQFYVQRIGADDFMKKPFSRAEVFARIERLVDAEGIPRRKSALAAIQASAAAEAVS